ncbi:M50 family metallopeptidase [Thermosynechococcus sp. HN-54]|uniref:M50 family metallopeptidase n=1 Tax=Thermosynechococcus sp. HN-54 TaxID=2933959 RepID=UPI00202CBDE9|nr:M50 family metallopeptidase [Thermosynechococcus sp. HN-54]URR36318.1 M50 family metallopeptidase [Thermosynechococcus sp. HN-54]
MFGLRPDPKSAPLNLSVNKQPRSALLLAIAALIAIILWQIPLGNYLLYPFTILATWFHEMGHGLTAVLLGGYFRELVIYPSGSGFARYGGEVLLGNLGHGLVAIGGPLGPAIAGSLFIFSSRSHGATDFCLKALGIMMLASVLLWVRSLFGIVFIASIGVAILLVAYQGNRWLKGIAIQFLGVQACISTFQQVNYLFTYAILGGQLSDTGLLQQYLWLPYWLWGALIAVMSLGLLLWSLKVAYTHSR